MARIDVIIMAITSQRKSSTSFGEIEIVEWAKAGLLKPSVVKPIVTTVEKKLLIRQLGKLESIDLKELRSALITIIG